MGEHSAVTTDAKSRALRTLVQGGIVAGVAAAASTTALIVGTWTGNDVLEASAWVGLGTSVVQAVLTSVASYVAGHVAPPK
jgi:hypothetical protein